MATKLDALTLLQHDAEAHVMPNETSCRAKYKLTLTLKSNEGRFPLTLNSARAMQQGDLSQELSLYLSCISAELANFANPPEAILDSAFKHFV